MNITEDIITAHKNLSNYSVKFLEFVQKNPESLERWNFRWLKREDKQRALQPWPTFINRCRKNEIKEESIKICNIIKSIPQRIFANDPGKMSGYYNIPRDIIEMQLLGATSEHIKNLLARGDYLFSHQGFKCLEYNITANLGGWRSAIWIPMYLKTPIISKFLQEYQVRVYNENLLAIVFKQMIRAALKKFNSGEREINLALVSHHPLESSSVYLAQIYEKALQVFNLKGKTVFCNYEQLEMIDEFLFFGNLKIHILHEQYHGVLSPEAMEVFKWGNICLYNGPITGLLSNKLNLALLSELQDTDIFTHHERELIKKYIPWTRKISGGDIGFGQDKRKGEDFLRLNREKLVLKFPDGFGGKGIFIGNKTPPDQWQQLTANAIKQGNWLIQEYIESQPYLYQWGEKGCAVHDMILGVFTVGDIHAGQWARILPKADSKGIINCEQGAEDSIVFEVEE